MAPSSRPPPRSRNQQHRRHSRTRSTSELLPPHERSEDDPPRRQRRQSPSTISTSNPLSADSLAQLDAHNEKSGWREEDAIRAHLRPEPTREQRRRDRDRDRGWDGNEERQRHRDRDHNRDRDTNRERDRRHHAAKHERRQRREGEDRSRYREKRRVVSGPLLEEGGHHTFHDDRKGRRGGIAVTDEDDRARRKKKKRIWIIAIAVVLLLVIIIAVAVGVSKNKHSSSNADSDDSGAKPANSNIKGLNPNSIPAAAQGTYLDPFTWYDTTDFNVTYTNVTVGGLPIMGLNSTWNNSARANPSVPPLTQSWTYGGTQKVHGMNLGGWLSIEPFITPSFFNAFPSADNVIDEYTLTSQLGPTAAAQKLEVHYSSFITEADFSAIAAAGFDHVRIPYSYWAITTYDGDPYVPKISWRYLLRGIEYARKYGLRVNLDLHGAPGSQNGWNHSGRQGAIGWLNGTDGALNAQRTIDIHSQLGAFFAQPRYKNLVTMYGLVNEPKMVALPTEEVTTWSQNAIDALHTAGLPTDVIIVVGDGFLGLANWKGSPLSGSDVLLDAHQYVIFNVEQLVLTHSAKISFACDGWTQQSQQSMSTSTGFGSFLCGEWSQADTDCQTYLNNVGWGNRWTGTWNTGNVSTSVLSPTCPTAQDASTPCDCTNALADPSSYSDEYKAWLITFAEAQMHSYEVGWGWFYWTWATEDATQWSYKLGMAAGILPTDVTKRDFDCSQPIPDFSGLGLSETY